MENRSTYNRLNNWTRDLSLPQYALLAGLVAFGLSVFVGLVFAGNRPYTAVMSAAGGATGATIVLYFLRKRDG